MARYRKRPVVIDAVQWNGINLEEIKEFVGADLVYNVNDAAWQVGEAPPAVEMSINTLEGDIHEVSVNDFVIKGVKGEFYACKPDIFAMTYEPVEE